MAIVHLEPKRRRVYAGEEVWFPLLDELGPRRLRAAFIKCEVSRTVAGNLVFFIEDQRLLDRHFKPETAVQYRKILRSLDPDIVARSAPG